jgi:hypothetical protein
MSAFNVPHPVEKRRKGHPVVGKELTKETVWFAGNWTIVAPCCSAKLRRLFRGTCRAFSVTTWTRSLIAQVNVVRFSNVISKCFQIQRLELITAMQMCISQLAPLRSLQELTLWFVGSGQLIVDSPKRPALLKSLSIYFTEGCTKEACMMGSPTYWWGLCRKLKTFQTNSITPLLFASAYLMTRRFQVEGTVIESFTWYDSAHPRKRHAGSEDALILDTEFVDTATLYAVPPSLGPLLRIPDMLPSDAIALELQDISRTVQAWLKASMFPTVTDITLPSFFWPYMASWMGGNKKITTGTSYPVHPFPLTVREPEGQRIGHEDKRYVNGPYQNCPRSLAQSTRSARIAYTKKVSHLEVNLISQDHLQEAIQLVRSQKQDSGQSFVIHHDYLGQEMLKLLPAQWTEQTLFPIVGGIVSETMNFIQSALHPNSSVEHRIYWPSPLDLCGDNATETLHRTSSHADYRGNRYAFYTMIWSTERFGTLLASAMRPLGFALLEASSPHVTILKFN